MTTSHKNERSVKINCPVCKAEFDVEEVLGHQFEERYRQDYIRKSAELEKDYKRKESALAEKEAAVKEQAAAIDKQADDKAKAEIARREKIIAQQAAERIKSDYEVQVKSLTEAAADAEKRLQEHKKTQLDNERLKRQLESQRSDFELELEKKITASVDEQRKHFTERLKTESELIAKREAERNEERVAELQKQLADARKAAEDAVRKSEQRSQQLQGEIQELAIEEFLKTTFPYDQITEVKKGQYGADVVQIVRNSIGKDTGIMLYESKNTEAFNRDWIDKLKADAVEAKADVLIIVTKTMPKGIEHTVLMEGVWVCPVKEFQGTAMVLRESLIRLADAYSAQTNKEGKMQMLYDYLTNGKFVDQIKQVISDFNELRSGYEKEKQSMQKIWKKRDAQIEAMLKNTTSFVTEIQVIAGASLPRLDSPEDELLALGEEVG